MDSILAFFSSYISYWPLVCFSALFLAGFNLPISEDVLIVMSALIAYEDRALLIPNYIALYAGIYISDIICYWMGRLIGQGVLKIKFFTKAPVLLMCGCQNKAGFPKALMQLKDCVIQESAEWVLWNIIP